MKQFSFNIVEKIYLGEGCQNIQDVVVGIILSNICLTVYIDLNANYDITLDEEPNLGNLLSQRVQSLGLETTPVENVSLQCGTEEEVYWKGATLILS